MNCFLRQMVLSISREVDHVGPNDRTPLHMAARRGYPEIARLLVSLETSMSVCALTFLKASASC